tara:strand:+ start:8917 stop:9957 length:1041 start_codon:yes stop_codon:yes gene_type:complete
MDFRTDKMQQTYSFDDVLLTPKYSDIQSRTEVDIGSSLEDSIRLDMPLISSPMDTVTGADMAAAIDKHGGLGIIHRYNTIEEQADLVYKSWLLGASNVGAAIGMTGDYIERADALVKSGAKVLCIDVAHGHHALMERCLKNLNDMFSGEIHLMAGNVATLGAFNDLASWGAGSIRVGIGGGSICSTRIVTGHGLPTLQSVFDCARSTYDTKIIADGGIKTTGDMVKALAAGADFVMVGSILAGTDETPGKISTSVSGEKFKEYRGMASKEAQRAWRGKNSTPEGVATVVPYRGSVEDVFADIIGGIRSGLSYTGARTLQQLRSSASFVIQSSAAQLESNTHILWRK